MSKPVTNVEIEDVLSSIRRLVSNGQIDRIPEASGEWADAEADRLVLTPSLRVDDIRREAVGVRVEAEQAVQPDASDQTVDAGSDGAELDVQPETGAGEAVLTRAETAESEAEEQGDRQPDAQSDLGTQAAEFEALVAGRDDQWEPDGASEDDYAGGPVSALNWQEAEECPEEEEPSTDPDWAEADDQTSERHAQSWQDEDRAHAAAAHQPDAERIESETVLLDDAVLDEDALRDLVAEIVRQELQGALGERITRNVRKLVRREIHRALTSHEAD